MAFSLKSTSLENGSFINKTYTCDGQDISPPLQWASPPAGVKSFALIMDDPDAPAGVWDHWLIYNIPASTNELSENLKKLPAGAMLGRNSWGKAQYNGPCPPGQEHHYIFKLFALDKMLDLKAGASRKELESAMTNHILGTAELMGRYNRFVNNI